MRSLRFRYLNVILAMGVAGSGCAPQGTHPPAKSAERPPPAVPPSPCDDRLYVALLDKELEAMTPREYEYFTRKDAECSEYRLRSTAGAAADAPYRETTEWPRAAETAPDSLPPARSPGVKSGTVIAIVALSAAAAIVAVAVMMSHTTVVVGW